MFQRLLICTDFKDGNYRFVNFVPELAASGIKRLDFLHVVSLDEAIIPKPNKSKVELAQARLAPALENIPGGVEVTVNVESGGKPSDVILRAAKKYNADLIVLGSPIRSLITETLFGSTSIALCQNTTVPLMILRPQLISTLTSEELQLRCRHLFRYLLIPYDASESARYLVEQIKLFASQDADRSLQQLHLCCVVETSGRRDLPLEYYYQEAEKHLAALRDDLRPYNLVVDPVEVRHGDPVTEVLESAKIADVSAIATSSSNLKKLFSGVNFAAELVRRSWHPLIFFPPKNS